MKLQKLGEERRAFLFRLRWFLAKYKIARENASLLPQRLW